MIVYIYLNASSPVLDHKIIKIKFSQLSEENRELRELIINQSNPSNIEIEQLQSNYAEQLIKMENKLMKSISLQESETEYMRESMINQSSQIINETEAKVRKQLI